MASEKEIKDTEKKTRQYKTDGGKTKSNAIEVPSISLPKGGGAIKGIDQKFTVNAVNGTAALSIPLPVSAARGAAPNLSLSYNSGGGNGIFGLGWNLGLPSIKRKTDKQLPQYNDYIESDTYLFSEAEDLVPEYKREGDGTFSLDANDDFIIKEDTSSFSGWTIHFYKPRVEGLFARIERWTSDTNGEIKWRAITKDNITTLYGWSEDSRIFDPLFPTTISKSGHIYEWLPEFVYDDKGNCAHYLYKREDDEGFNDSFVHNRNRKKAGDITYTNLYIDKIRYGNIVPYNYDFDFLDEVDYMFQTVFDYGQYNSASPYDISGTWNYRSDAFSEYKSGFEIRTTRLCKRVLLFHYFSDTELPYGPALVKSIDFQYDDNDNEGFTFLISVTSRGYIKYATDTYSDKSLPPIEFTYSPRNWNTEVKEITTGNLLHAPTGLKAPYQFTDLYNEGLSGILSEQGNAWFYKRNIGEGNFEAAHQVTPKPAFSGLGGSLQLLDLEGDGVKQLVSFNSNPQGYFELDDDNTWQTFKGFKNLPNINLNDPNAKLIDLNGDGKTDVLVTEDSVFTWWESDGRNGFKDYHRSPKFLDEEEGPRLVFAERTQTIHLADMSGDGLVDLVRIRNGEVCYWPNLGYGKFGSKIVMDNAPVFDNDADYDPAWVKLADIDGSGTPDLIYLGENKFSCWLNFNGNSYSSTPVEIEGFPSVTRDADITVTDLLGNGLSCIVWSSPLQKDAQAPLRYIDMMNSVKPHIMVKQINNMGMEVEMEYTPSTKFYIEDKLAGRPWVTKLHFPVYCLSKVITSDKVTGNEFTSTYSYHHGYYDHAEKEFRGFGRVDQTDSEKTESWDTEFDDDLDEDILIDRSLNQASVLTRSWFHTGAYTHDKKILDQFKQEYWFEEYERELGSPPSHPEIDLPAARIVPDQLNVANEDYVDNILPIEKREAFRSCKSMPLRTEVFTREGTTAEQYTPFSVSTHNCMIELLQPLGKNKHAIFCVKESESITYSYERRDTDDPRIAHSLNLEMDVYGNILKSAKIVYPRLVSVSGLPGETQLAQDKTAIIYTENDFTNDVSDPVNYRLRVPSETKTYEITGLTKVGDIYMLEEFDDVLSDSTLLAYELDATSGQQARLIEHVKSLYYNNYLTAALSLGTLESLGLPYENYQLAYTNNSGIGHDLLNAVFGGMATSTEMTDGKFIQFGDNNWWIRSGIVNYIDTGLSETVADAIDRFFTPISFTNQYNSVTTVSYESNYYLFIEETVDALGNTNTVETFDYRTLSPVKMKDANDNESEIILDELGLPKAMALYGKGSEGDDLSVGFTPETLSTELLDISYYFDEANSYPTDSSNLDSLAGALLNRATVRFVYDLFSYMTTAGVEPCVVSTIMREEHYNVDSGNTKKQISFEYSGGSGKVVMKKMQAEPGDAKEVTFDYTDPDNVVVNVSSVSSGSNLRWIGNGRTVFNNKGNPVKQYEPYFSLSAKYENTKELVDNGVTPLIHYDALGRVLRTDFPDGTFTKTDYFGWKQVEYDQNDNSVGSDWEAFMQGQGAIETAAAAKAAAHYNTPKIIHFDTLGRPVCEQEEDGVNSTLYTLLFLDIEGNLRAVQDARGNITMQYKYDMLGQMVYQLSADSGQRWLLHDCMSAPLRTWDERYHTIKFEYDALHRPLTVSLDRVDPSLPTLTDNIVESYIYGETASTPKTYNLNGNLYQHYDTGGLEQMAAYDFKNQRLSTERWLAADYKNLVDWNPLSPSTLEGTSFVISTLYDALGRIKEQTAPDGSIIYPYYSERGVLVSEDVDQGAGTINHLQTINYDAKGQRTYVEYGNGVYTTYTYDERSFRLTHLLTEGPSGVLQDLFYTYDAVGNITWKQDDNIPDAFYNNSIIKAGNEYTYDAKYQLVFASGREAHPSWSVGSGDNWDDAQYMKPLNPGDPLAIHNYEQNYLYDECGNIKELQHTAIGHLAFSFTRSYNYEGSNNRLRDTDDGSGPYNYNYHNEHGFLTDLPHLPVLKWNFKEEICETSRQSVTAPAVPETTWYQYDSKGKRLRKITENYSPSGPGTQKNMRIYIEGYEYYEEFGGGDITNTLSLIDEGRRFVMIEDSSTYGLHTRYEHPNHQGSCTLETNENGEVIYYEEFHPFGTTSYQAKDASINAAYKRYRYTGMERDEETGLNYHNARYYIPWLCRWMNPDPIGIGDGVNVYAYSRNNPITFKDTKGTQTAEMEANDVADDLKKKVTVDKTAVNVTDPTKAGKTPDFVIEAARMAAHAYGDKEDSLLSGGWKQSDPDFVASLGVTLEDKDIGFLSALYERVIESGPNAGEKEYVYATAGTNELKDWKDNLLTQPVGMSDQYALSKENAINLSKNLKNLTFVGHSLGGGLAAHNAYATGRNAVTFNAAGLSILTGRANKQSNVEAYVTSKDILNALQDAIAIAPNVDGNRHNLVTGEIPTIGGHLMGNVLGAFGVDLSKFMKSQSLFKTAGTPPVNPLQSAPTMNGVPNLNTSKKVSISTPSVNQQQRLQSVTTYR